MSSQTQESEPEPDPDTPNIHDELTDEEKAAWRRAAESDAPISEKAQNVVEALDEAE